MENDYSTSSLKTKTGAVVDKRALKKFFITWIFFLFTNDSICNLMKVLAGL